MVLSRCLLALFLLSHLNAIADSPVPAPLQPWVEWALHDRDDLGCPISHHKAEHHCLWVSELTLDADARGLRFEMLVEAVGERWLTLPGSDMLWPQEVVLSERNRDLPLRAQQGKPQVRLPAGQHWVEGNIRWAQMPQQLPLPANAGIVRLRLNGQPVALPEIDAQHQLWLKRSEAGPQQQEKASAKVQVFRLLQDHNPAQVLTRVVLDISGPPRELSMGEFLLPGFTPLQLDSPLPARIEQQRLLRVQVRPGRWQIDLLARSDKPLSRLGFQSLDDLWPKEELWAFEADRRLRTVQASGATPVDPTQTNLPAEWHGFPSFRLASGESLAFDERLRGDPSPEADSIRVARDLYLDFSGRGFTVSDAVFGEIKRSWRLDSARDMRLGSARLHEQPQLITLSADGSTQGIELRDGNLDLRAQGRVEGRGVMQASGWQTDVNGLSATLHLPPGWSLLATRGVDQASHSWLSRWSLWHIFLFLITSVAIFRLGGPALGAVAAVTLLLIFHRGGAPVLLWLVITVMLTLVKLAEGKLRVWCQWGLAAAFALLVLQLLPFATLQLREAVYPQLKHRGIDVGGEEFRMPDRHHADMAVKAQAPEEEEIVVTGSRRSSPSSLLKEGLASSYSYSEESVQRSDPNAIVQTGPGVPRWHWDSVELHWSGPVSQAEQLRLYLVPPWLNRLGNVAAVLLCGLLALLLWQRGRAFLRLPPLAGGATVASACLLLALGLPPQPAQADVTIDNELLKELRERLLKPAECLPDCASIERVDIVAEGQQLRLLLVVDALEPLAFPLPAARNTWLPQQSWVDERPAVLKSADNLQLLVKLGPGRHRIRLEGPVSQDQLELRFGLAAHNVSVRAEGWEVSGLRAGNLPSGTLQLQRSAQRVVDDKVLLPDPVPPFVRVTRQLSFGLEWYVDTVVQRVAPQQGAISLKIPLLPGESPTAELDIRDGAVHAVLAANQQQLRWRSVLAVAPTLQLKAAEGLALAEVWSLDVAPLWHLRHEGIPPIQESGQRHRPTWMPWPGESLTLHIARPPAAEGQNLTVDAVELNHTLGQRLNQSELRLDLRTSRGQIFPFTLPEGAVLEGLSVNGEAQPLASTTGRIDIALRPGEQQVALRWRSEAGIASFTHLPEINLGTPASNLHLHMQLPEDRWILAVGGPAMGPAVLVWGAVLVLLLVSLALGHLAWTPLHFHHWALLGLGMLSTNLFALILVAAWLFALGWRGRAKLPSHPERFRMLQLSLIILSVVALLGLLATIPAGLLSRPDMHIVGNGSYAHSLRWYQDLSSGALPDAWVLSLPMFVYRIAMLLWSLWLAFALLRWLKWGWAQMNVGGFWLPESQEQNSKNEHS